MKEVAKAAGAELNDEVAKKLGIEKPFDRLRTVVREQIEGQYGQITRQKVVGQILDGLDEYQFETIQNVC